MDDLGPRSTALHEAAHAVVAFVLGGGVDLVSTRESRFHGGLAFITGLRPLDPDRALTERRGSQDLLRAGASGRFPCSPTRDSAAKLRSPA